MTFRVVKPWNFLAFVAVYALLSGGFLSAAIAQEEMNPSTNFQVYLDRQVLSQPNVNHGTASSLMRVHGSNRIASITTGEVTMFDSDEGYLLRSRRSNFSAGGISRDREFLAVDESGERIAFIQKDDDGEPRLYIGKLDSLSIKGDQFNDNALSFFLPLRSNEFRTRAFGAFVPSGAFVAAFGKHVYVLDQTTGAGSRIHSEDLDATAFTLTHGGRFFVTNAKNLVDCQYGEKYTCQSRKLPSSDLESVDLNRCDQLATSILERAVFVAVGCANQLVFLSTSGYGGDLQVTSIGKRDAIVRMDSALDGRLFITEKILLGADLSWRITSLQPRSGVAPTILSERIIFHRRLPDLQGRAGVTMIQPVPPIVLGSGALLFAPTLMSPARVETGREANNLDDTELRFPLAALDADSLKVVHAGKQIDIDLLTGAIQKNEFVAVKAVYDVATSQGARFGAGATVFSTEKESTSLQINRWSHVIGENSTSKAWSFPIDGSGYRNDVRDWRSFTPLALNDDGIAAFSTADGLVVCDVLTEGNGCKFFPQFAKRAVHHYSPNVSIGKVDATGRFTVAMYFEDDEVLRFAQLSRAHADVNVNIRSIQIGRSPTGEARHTYRLARTVPEWKIASSGGQVAFIAPKGGASGLEMAVSLTNETGAMKPTVIQCEGGASTLAFTSAGKLLVGSTTGVVYTLDETNQSLYQIARLPAAVSRIVTAGSRWAAQSGFLIAVFSNGDRDAKKIVDVFVNQSVKGGGSGVILMIGEGFFSGDYLFSKSLLLSSKSTESKPLSIAPFYDAFHRPDLVRRKLAGEDIRQYIGDLTIEKALQSPPPRVTMGATLLETKSDRLKIPYTITPDVGGIAEVRAFHNGKLVMSDGTYKDAIGNASTTALAANAAATATPTLGPDGKPRSINVSTLRTAIPRAASASDGPALLPISASVSSAGKPGNTSELPADLIVRSAPEKKCNPCTGEIEVDVIPGEENTITVVAFNRDNTIQSLPASVTFKSTLPKEAPKLWVLSVGIDQFKSVDLLRNARKDATDFACTYAGKRALQANPKLSGIACDQPGTANGLFKPENINVIDVQLDNFATKANLLAQLNEVAQRAKPQDTFVWFVASHGMMEGTTGLFGIVAHDTLCTAVDPQTQKLCTQMSGYISSNEILEASKQIKAMKQLMVLDTCHSGGLDNKLSGLYDARMSVLAKNMGLHLYASAQATEAAQDGIPGTNGTFTAQLLAGIKGAAKQDAEGNISIVSLGEYAKQKTIEATQPKAKPNTNTAVATNASNAKGSATSTQAAQTPVIQHFGVDAPVARGR